MPGPQQSAEAGIGGVATGFAAFFKEICRGCDAGGFAGFCGVVGVAEQMVTIWGGGRWRRHVATGEWRVFRLPHHPVPTPLRISRLQPLAGA
jgi:hypothetical protein